MVVSKQEKSQKWKSITAVKMFWEIKKNEAPLKRHQVKLAWQMYQKYAPPLEIRSGWVNSSKSTLNIIFAWNTKSYSKSPFLLKNNFCTFMSAQCNI